MRYYDKILAGMSSCLISGASIGFLTPISSNFAIGAGAAASMGFMYHGMFRNAPVPE